MNNLNNDTKVNQSKTGHILLIGGVESFCGRNFEGERMWEKPLRTAFNHAKLCRSCRKFIKSRMRPQVSTLNGGKTRSHKNREMGV